MQHFYLAGKQLNFAHAARTAGVARAEVIASVKALESELGYALFDYSAATTTLTDAGEKLYERARAERDSSGSTAQVKLPGGKAKASKGKGRTPAVKGAPRVGKRRQSR
ncbi:MAG: LysR family transcriptional regulator [Microbacteriaceae bacterium]|jgi:DNA-binding transcriptional LysR family regulator|nr:LysR family transcriptional regulator [Microbacteriaceae bacterium]